MTTFTNYGQLSVTTVTGTIYHVEAVPNNGQPFLSVSVIHYPVRDGAPLLYTFNDSDAIMSLFEKGHFPKGRKVTITGHIKSVSEIYTDKESGETFVRKYPHIHLIGVSVPYNGLGALPKDAAPVARKAVKVQIKPTAAKATAPTDVAPSKEEVTDFV